MNFVMKFVLISVCVFLFFYFKTAARRPLDHWYARVGWRFRSPKFVEPSRAAIGEQRFFSVLAMVSCVIAVIVIALLPSDGDLRREREQRLSRQRNAPSLHELIPSPQEMVRDRHPYPTLHAPPRPTSTPAGAAPGVL